jgi:hypothetical protein
MLKFYYNTAPNPAVRAEALKDRFKFKTENDAEAVRFLFPTLAAVSAKT